MGLLDDVVDLLRRYGRNAHMIPSSVRVRGDVQEGSTMLAGRACSHLPVAEQRVRHTLRGVVSVGFGGAS